MLTSASRGPSAIAELLVHKTMVPSSDAINHKCSQSPKLSNNKIDTVDIQGDGHFSVSDSDACRGEPNLDRCLLTKNKISFNFRPCTVAIRVHVLLVNNTYN